jgi:hypothetical protein
MHSFGAKLSSNGFGLHYNFSTRITYRLRRFYEAEYSLIKDQKEIKSMIINPTSYTTKRFVYGKINSAHSIKGGYGYNRMIFEKRDKSSISIHLLGSAGASLTFCKPIYYNIADSIVNNRIFSSDRKFDGSRDELILGRSLFIKGISETTLHPGVYTKFGIGFDFSRDVEKTSILEIGTSFDYYFRKLEIMHKNPHSYFLSFYLMYSFGQKYDARLDRDYRKELRKNQRKNSE